MLFLSACSTGNQNQSPQEVGFQGGDYGPIPISLYNPVLANKINFSIYKTRELNGAGGAAEIAAASAVIASIFPPGAVVFGVISVVSGLVAANQVAGQINQINSDLSYQETQIQGIYSILDNSYKQIYNLTLATEEQKLEADYNNWFNNIFAPSLFYGYGKSTSNIIGLNNQNVTEPWYQSYTNVVIESNPSINSMATSSESIVNILQNVAYSSKAMASLNTYSQNNASNFVNVINATSLSATTTNSTNTALIIESVSLSSNNTNNATVQLLLAAENSLQVILPRSGTIAASNYMLAVESYNQFINSVYLSNLSVLQSLYTIEATNNYLNYLNFVSASELKIALTQICPLEANGDTTNIFNTINFYAGGASNCSGQSATVFYPNGYNINTINNNMYEAINLQNAESAFVYAQQQLTNLYARRVNTLYQQTMKFIYSDYSYPQQGINYTTNQPNLSPEMQAVIESTPQVKFISNPVQNYSMLSGNWVNTSNIYQYPITNIDTTNSNIESSINNQLQINPNIYPTIPAINDNNYPTVFQNIQSGYYDGESIAVYNNQLSASQTPFYFSESCTISNGVYYWSAGNQLICMTWSIANNYSINFNNSSNSYNFQLSNGNIPTPGWLPTEDVGGVYYLLGGYFNVASSDQDYHIYYNSNSIVNSSAFSLINGNGNFFVNDNSLYDGGFYKSGSNYHTAAIQVTLPNNFNLPFYILGKGSNSSASAYASLQLACPAANNSTTTSSYQNMLIPSVTSCDTSGTNGNTGTSVIKFTLSDGSSYRLQLNGGGGAGLHQDAYLELSN